MRRAALSLDLVLSVLYLFLTYNIAGAFSSVSSVVEQSVSSPACLMVAESAALSHSAAQSVFGMSTEYNYATVEPDLYSVSVSGGKVRVTVHGFEGDSSCVVSIP